MIKYAIVTPAFNEAENLPKLIKSVKNQSILPTKHIVVNDASTDGTEHLLELYKGFSPWFDFITIWEKGKRSGSHVKAMNVGVDCLKRYYVDWDYLVVLDADVELSNPRHIENLITIMKKRGASIISGQLEGETSNTPRGCGRIYTKEFILKHRFPEMSAWDTFHLHIAYLKGMKTILCPNEILKPLRPSFYTIKHAYKRGTSCAILRYPFVYMIGRALLELKGLKGIITLFTYLVFRPLAWRFKMSKQLKNFTRRLKIWAMLNKIS